MDKKKLMYFGIGFVVLAILLTLAVHTASVPKGEQSEAIAESIN